MPSEHFPDRAVPLGPSTTFLLLTGLFAVSILSALGSEAPAVIERPAADLGPTQVSVGMWVVDISNIDSAQQNFTAEIAVVLRWKDSRLAHAGNGVVRYPLEQVWHPRVVIVNETNSVTHKLPESVEAEHDGTVLYRQRYVGAFTQPLRLRSFPFDRQTFHIELVAVRYRPNEVTFVPNQLWIRDGLRQAGGIAPSARLDDREMGYQGSCLRIGARLGELELCLRIHRSPQCIALHSKSNVSACFDRDNVMGGLLDGSNPFQRADQYRDHFDAHPDRLSFRNR